MRQPPRQFAPRRHALRLHQLFLLHRQSTRHIVERGPQLPDLIRPAHIDPRIPATGRHLARTFRKLFHRTRDPRRHPQGHQQTHQNRRRSNYRRNRHNALRQQHKFLTRAADQKHRKQLFVPPQQRHRVESLGGSCVGLPINRLHDLLRPFLELLNQRPKALRRIRGAVHIRKRRRHECRLHVPIEQRPHPRREDQCRKKILVEPPPADKVKALVVAAGNRAHGCHRQGYPIRQFFLFQKRRRPAPILACRNPIILISNSRRILRRRNNRAVPVYEFYEIHPVILRHPDCIVHIQRLVRVRSRKIHGRSERNLPISHILDLLCHISAALFKFLIELRD